ncbi:MAG: hypothetical protein P8R42_30290 [Candidatus Binatia bacterium]|nr:hypothetical protein [Candidatus Binatia bacterium]
MADEQDKKEKKEKVLHARIPESLDEEIREHAAQLGLSVSNLVRNVLGNAVGLVDEIIADTAGVARSATGGKAAPQPNAASAAAAQAEPRRVLGWQEAILNMNAVCDRCNTILEKGSRGAIAIVEGVGPRPMRCVGCIEEKSNEND